MAAAAVAVRIGHIHPHTHFHRIGFAMPPMLSVLGSTVPELFQDCDLSTRCGDWVSLVADHASGLVQLERV